MKIHILGGPGSGKTTLARNLARRFHVPHHDLDLVGQRHGTNAAGHIDEAFATAATPGWITEGIYLVLVDPLLYEAGHIILLDIPWRVAAWRIVKRHVVQTLRGTNQYPGLRSLWFFLGYARGYYRDEHTEHADLMARCLQEHAAMPLPPTRDRMIAFLETYHPVSIPPGNAFVRRYLEKCQSKVVVVRTNADLKRLYGMLTT